MLNFSKKKLLISIISAVLLVSFSFFGMFDYCRTYSGKISLLLSNSKVYSKTAVSIDNMARRMFNIDDKADEPVVPQKASRSEKRKFSGLVFYLLATIIVAKDKSIILLISSFMSASNTFVKFLQKGAAKIKIPPELKFYEWWALKFLSPLQKSIFNRSDIYDINPMGFYGRGISIPLNSPHFVL
jgi:hypothetical protein